jgi:hypothetical protein
MQDRVIKRGFTLIMSKRTEGQWHGLLFILDLLFLACMQLSFSDEELETSMSLEELKPTLSSELEPP